MNIKEYCEKYGQKHLAELMDVTVGMVSHWVTGRVRITAERAVELEEATKGEIPKWGTRPDLWDKPD